MERDKLSCHELVRRMDGLMAKKANQELTRIGITFSQMKVMGLIHWHPEHDMMLKDIERFFELSQATVAGIVVRLEAKHLLESYIDPEDRRVKHVRLTSDGQAICKHVEHSIEQCEGWILGALEPEEQEELHRLLLKTYTYMRDTGN